MTIEMKKIDITDKKYLREGWSGLLLDAFFKYISTNCENYWGEPGGEAREATEDNEKCAICTLEFSLHGMEAYASNRLSNDAYHRSSYRLPHCTIYGTFSSLEQEINYDIPVMVQFRTSKHDSESPDVHKSNFISDFERRKDYGFVWLEEESYNFHGQKGVPLYELDDSEIENDTLPIIRCLIDLTDHEWSLARIVLSNNKACPSLKIGISVPDNMNHGVLVNSSENKSLKVLNYKIISTETYNEEEFKKNLAYRYFNGELR